MDQQLRRILGNHIHENGLGLLLGDTDTIFGKYDVRRPDLLYFTKARMHLVMEDQAIDGPPDLCVEILSPGSVQIDRKDKFQQYAKGNVAYYWLVDPLARCVEAFKLTSGKYTLITSGVNGDTIVLPPFPDLRIPLSEIWFPQRDR